MMAFKVGGWCPLIPIAAYGLFVLIEDGPGGDDVDGLDAMVGMFLDLLGLPMLALGLGLSAVGLCVLIWRRPRLRRTG